MAAKVGAGLKKEGAFALNHPLVPASYVLAMLVFTMAAMHPVLVACSLAGAFTYCCLVRGARETAASLRWQLPLIALIALLNPLFSASGSTELFRIGVRAVYLESLLYGCCMGALFVASVLWFQAAGTMLSFDKVMALFGNAAPTICLMISMCMRLIPRFIRLGQLILAVQDANTRKLGTGTSFPRQRVCGASSWASARNRLRASSVLMGWSMEDSLETADSMRARGWNSGRKRSTYTRYRFTGNDAAALALLAAGAVVCTWIAVCASSSFSFYPVMGSLRFAWGYVIYAAWCFVPSAVFAAERRLLA